MEVRAYALDRAFDYYNHQSVDIEVLLEKALRIEKYLNGDNTVSS
jgi:hypothetical protein